MAKDRDKGKETKPFLETKDAAKIQDVAVEAKEVEAKDVPTFQPSKKENSPPPAKIQSKCRSHQIFGATKFGFYCCSALIAELLVVRRKGVHQAIPPFLPSHRRYHPYLLDCY